ncbi:hypothetical protein HD599_003242 [Conyzicola lurida]|uniref:Uncharacterized protein n=2 Tax=Conyzicola lurida TaxID=1172621 RepID=A0A841AU35_9MICO|nr:hypothetical protein [Conyzicola lurida]
MDDDRALALIGGGDLGEDRTELTLEQAGQWLVLSLTSAHFFDLDLMLVARIPGNGAMDFVTDPGRELRTLDRCRVGDVGFWTMMPLPHEQDLEFRWHQSSLIQRIVRTIGLERLPGFR